MSDAKAGTVVALHRYPVKGMSGQSLQVVNLEAGGTMPFDRAYAVENGPGRFDPLKPRHVPKVNFLMLMRDERLATLTCQFDEATQTLTLYRAGKQVASGTLATPLGRRMIEQFLAAYMKAELRGPPRIVSAPGHSFSDVPVKCLHVINLASVRELERVAGRPIHPGRFRANLVLDGWPAWAEFKLLGRTITVGGVDLEVFDRTSRCEATNVDPVTAARDMSLPSLLQRTWSHSDFGVYAKVINAGTIKVGDPVLPR